MDNRITPWLPPEERGESRADPPMTLAEALRYEAGFAIDKYLDSLISMGDSTNKADHEDLGRMRLHYLRLLEGIEWADDLEKRNQEGGDHGN